MPRCFSQASRSCVCAQKASFDWSGLRYPNACDPSSECITAISSDVNCCSSENLFTTRSLLPRPMTQRFVFLTASSRVSIIPCSVVHGSALRSRL